MVTEMVMDCSLNHDNSNGSSASNAGSPRPPGVSSASEGATKAPQPQSPSSGPPSSATPRDQDMYHQQRSPSPQGGAGPQGGMLHGGGGGGGFDASGLGRQHLGHLPTSAQLSPPMQSAMMHPMRHLGPPGLGLFNSLVQHAGHASPLEFMAAAQAQAQAQAHHGHPGAHQGHQGHPGAHPPRSYNSPPPISSSDPTANECKLVTYRGQKVAAFMISGETMLCLPQAFELFLKHLVGGLHTVYTKLKRLDIVPLVCNVEQVRILRGLGAIQPGVNRCKLLACKDFDTLYRDCTTARCLTSHRTPDSSRPGRPPKRVPMGLSLPASLQGHPQLKKHRMENGDFASFENGPIGENRMEKSPLLSNGYNAPPTHLHPMHQFYHPGLPHPGSVLKGQGNAPLEAIARSGIWEDCRAAYEDIVKHLERLRENRGEADARQTALSSMGSMGSQGDQDFANGHSPVLNLSKGTAGSAASAASAGSRASAGSPVDHSDSEAGASDKDDDDDINSNAEEDDDERGSHHHHQDTKPPRSSPGSSPPPLPANLAHLTVGVGVAPLAGLGAGLAAGLGGAKATVGGDPRLTSTETILRNIEGLLQVAADNARQQERQINMEKAELKMDVMREREVKESLERQLQDETTKRVMCQRRLKKVRRASKRLQEQLELEMKRRSQLEDMLRTTGASSEALRILTEMKASSTGSASEMTSPRSTSSPAERRSASPATTPRPQSQPQSQPPSAHPRSFWQNYSENLAQELENERKAKAQHSNPSSQQEHRQQLHDAEPIAMDLDSKPLVQDLRWPTEHRAAIIS